MMATNTTTTQPRLPAMRHFSSSPPALPSDSLAPRPEFDSHRAQTFHHHQQRNLTSLYLDKQQSHQPPRAAAKADHNSECDLSLSDEDMLLCSDDDDVDNWSGGGSDGKNNSRQGSAASGGGNSRSRRLLSVEQSKVLYKILETTHFPSTQLREQVANQLSVSPRKVQVWFQNRRQVGKKRMIEAVQSALAPHNHGSFPHSSRSLSRPYGSSASVPLITLEMLQEQLKATGKARFNPDLEDERTRAWRKHTIRLALNPGAMEEEESRNAIAELERHQHQHQQGRSRAMQSVSRSVASLRINIPAPTGSMYGGGMGGSTIPLSAKTPVYTGPGSATHLETLSRSALPALPPLTPAAVRTAIIPPAVSSQKESFTLYNARHYPAPPSAAAAAAAFRSRSQTIASPHHPSLSSVSQGEAMREVRGNLTLEWQNKQRAYEQNLLSTQSHSQRYAPRAGAPVRNLHTHQTPSGGLRYRSSTDALTRIPPFPPTPRPSLSDARRSARYSPYSRTSDLAPLPSTPRPTAGGVGGGGSLHLLPPNFSSSISGRGRSVSSPHQFIHPTSPSGVGGSSHTSSTATTATTTSLRWNPNSNSDLNTPSTASTRSSPTTLTRSKPQYERKDPVQIQNQREVTVRPKIEEERLDTRLRPNPMDLRSLTTSNLANM